MTTQIISDIHFPYQDDKAVNIALKINQKMRPAEVIINGDMLDFPQVSRFTMDPDVHQTLERDINMSIEFIKKLQRYSSVTVIEGNHEIRLNKYILENAPELKSLVSLEAILSNNLDDDIKYIDAIGKESMYWYDDSILIGHFNRVSKNSAYTAKLLVEQYKCNIIQAHVHRLGSHYFTGYKETLVGFEMGCLCSIYPEYMAKPNWQQGFLMYNRIGSNTEIETIHIADGKALYRGKEYRG